MNFSILSESTVLQSFGIAIFSSFWQGLILWVFVRIFQFMSRDKASVIRYNVGLMALFIMFVSFISTLLISYFTYNNNTTSGNIFIQNQFFQDTRTGLSLVSIIYLVFFFFNLVRFLNAINYTKNISNRYNIKPEIEIRLFTKLSQSLLGIRRKVEIWISKNVNVPTVTGFTKPVILLPIAAVNNLTIKQLESIILHELVHIKRNDFIINLVQTLIETILFFNPFVHLINKEIRNERENCCDDWIINFNYNKKEYAKALMILEENRQSNIKMALAATNGRKPLLKRIKRLFSTINTNPSVSGTQKLKISLIFSFLSAGMLFFSAQTARLQKSETPVFSAEIHPVKAIPMKVILSQSVPEKKTYIARKSLFLNKKDEKTSIKSQFLNKNHQNENADNITYINESLTNPGLLNDAGKIKLVSESETPDDKMAYVQIEEEQSGKDQHQVYYFKIDKNGSKTFVTPLILLNRQNSDTTHKTLQLHENFTKRLKITL